MSWHVHGDTIPAAEFVKAIEAATLPPEHQAFREEAQHQLDAAKKAAVSLALSGAVGDLKKGGHYSFSLSGHANPGHAPFHPYSNDSVTANVGQVDNKP